MPLGRGGVASVVGAEATIGVLWLPTVRLVHESGGAGSGKLGCRWARSNLLFLKH